MLLLLLLRQSPLLWWEFAPPLFQDLPFLFGFLFLLTTSVVPFGIRRRAGLRCIGVIVIIV